MRDSYFYILKCTITNNKKERDVFDNYELAKEVYVAYNYNLSIKACKLYKSNGKKMQLVEKFKKRKLISLNGKESN